MNDKLKQSLEGRLCGMRWGEREQAEVFRQIQRKELQDVKHVKRSTGMLAVAIAMLFIVMGAAFALTQNGQPADSRIAGQTAEPTFAPLPMAQYENDYVIMTIDSAHWQGEDVAIELTLTLKEPEKYALAIGPYHNPGSADRTLLTTRIDARWRSGTHSAVFSLDDTEVVSMTANSAAIRMASSSMGAEENAVELILALSASPYFTDEFTITLTREPAAAATPRPLWVLENELITGYITETRIEGDQLHLTVDVEPKKPWYVINTTAPDKSTLNVWADWAGGYDDAPYLWSIPVFNPNFEPTETGARLSAVIPFPFEHQRIRLIGELTAKDPVTGTELTSSINTSVYRPGASPTETASPQPTATPVPATPTSSPQPVLQRSTPTGEHVGGTERVSVYLEDIWYDGFCAEATLRIRADDAADRLATTPNANGVPSENTWVVKLEGSWNDYYRSVITPTLTLEPDTGDVLVQLSYENLHDSESSNFYLPITLTVTNEKTWEAETDDISLRPEISGTYVPQPLYLVSSSMDNLFLQGSLLTTDRYHYVGVMISPDAAHLPIGHLLDENGAEIAEGRYVNVNGKSLKTFPRTLFPYDGDDQSQFHLIVIRVDKAVTLADPLPVHLTKWTQKEGYTDLADMTLNTTPPAPSAVHQQISIILDKNVLFDNEHVTVAFIDADYGYGHAFAHLNAALKDTANYTTVAEGHTETHLDIQLSFAEYRAGQAASPVAFTALTDSDDSWKRSFYLHGYSESWTAAQPPVVLARLSLQSEDGSICEEYTAVFTFPASGEVRLYSMAPAEEEYRPYFSYAGGQLADTDYLSALSLQYTCDSSVDQASCSVHARSYPVEPSHQEDRLLELIDSETQKRQSDVLCPYLYFDPDNLQIPWFTLFVRDAVHNHLLAEIPILLTPIAD